MQKWLTCMRYALKGKAFKKLLVKFPDVSLYFVVLLKKNYSILHSHKEFCMFNRFYYLWKAVKITIFYFFYIFI